MSNTHWTNGSPGNFEYRILFDCINQIETYMDKVGMSKQELADKLGVSYASLADVFEEPGECQVLFLISIVRTLGLKVSLVVYDDGDPENKRGPIYSGVFVDCWERQGQPYNYEPIEEI